MCGLARGQARIEFQRDMMLVYHKALHLGTSADYAAVRHPASSCAISDGLSAALERACAGTRCRIRV